MALRFVPTGARSEHHAFALVPGASVHLPGRTSARAVLVDVVADEVRVTLLARNEAAFALRANGNEERLNRGIAVRLCVGDELILGPADAAAPPKDSDTAPAYLLCDLGGGAQPAPICPPLPAATQAPVGSMPSQSADGSAPDAVAAGLPSLLPPALGTCPQVLLLPPPPPAAVQHGQTGPSLSVKAEPVEQMPGPMAPPKSGPVAVQPVASALSAPDAGASPSAHAPPPVRGAAGGPGAETGAAPVQHIAGVPVDPQPQAAPKEDVTTAAPALQPADPAGAVPHAERGPVVMQAEATTAVAAAAAAPAEATRTPAADASRAVEAPPSSAPAGLEGAHAAGAGATPAPAPRARPAVKHKPAEAAADAVTLGPAAVPHATPVADAAAGGRGRTVAQPQMTPAGAGAAGRGDDATPAAAAAVAPGSVPGTGRTPGGADALSECRTILQAIEALLFPPTSQRTATVHEADAQLGQRRREAPQNQLQGTQEQGQQQQQQQQGQQQEQHAPSCCASSAVPTAAVGGAAGGVARVSDMRERGCADMGVDATAVIRLKPAAGGLQIEAEKQAQEERPPGAIAASPTPDALTAEAKTEVASAIAALNKKQRERLDGAVEVARVQHALATKGLLVDHDALCDYVGWVAVHRDAELANGVVLPPFAYKHDTQMIAFM